MKDICFKTTTLDVDKLFPDKDLITLEEVFEKLEELYDEKEMIEQEFEDFKKDVEDNYRPLSYEEQLGSW